MADASSQPSEPSKPTVPDPPKKRFKELLSTAFHGYLEEHPFAKAVYSWFRKEGKGVKSGWVLFSVLAVGLMALAGYGVNWIDQKLEDAEMSATNGIHAAKIDELNDKIDQLKSEKSDLIRQRDKSDLQAQNDRNALAPWMELAKSRFADENPSNSLALLFEHVIAMESRAPKFEVFLNRQPIINDQTTVPLATNREVDLKVKNNGEETAAGLEVSITTPLNETNVLCQGWIKTAGDIEVGGETIEGVNNWRMVADHGIAFGDGFPLPAFKIETNLPSIPVSNEMMKRLGWVFYRGSNEIPPNAAYIPMEITVFSLNSKRKTIRLLLKY